MSLPTSPPGRGLRLSIALVVLLSVRPAHADGPWHHLGLEDGLAHTSVYDLELDQDGFLLVASEGGLQRWDGHRFYPLHRSLDASRLLGSDNVGFLYRDPDRPEWIWIGTWGGGLARLDTGTGAIHTWSHEDDDPASLTDDRIQAVLRDGRSRLWVGTFRGLDRLDPDSGTITHWRPPDLDRPDRFWALDEDPGERLWAATDDGLLVLGPDRKSWRRYRADPDDPRALPHPEVRHVRVTRAGEVWVATRNGVRRYAPESDDFDPIPLPPAPPGARAHSVNVLVEDAEGRLWAGGHRAGLLLWDPVTETFRATVHDPSRLDSLPGNDVRDILLDANRNLWVATRGAGLGRLDTKPKKFERYLEEQVKAIAATEDGSLWAGTLDGLVRLDADRHETRWTTAEGRPSADTIRHDIVQALEVDSEGRLWVGTYAGLDVFDARSLQRLDPRDVRPELPEQALSASYEAILAEPSGDLWLGTRKGLWHLPPRGEPRLYGRESRGLRDEFVRCLYREGDTLWIGTDTGGLHRLDLRTDTFDRYHHDPGDLGSLSSDRVYAVTRAPADAGLWVATDYGLNRLGEDGAFERLVEPLPNPSVVGLLASDDGLWIATYRGLAHLSLPSREIFSYDVHDGLQDPIFSNGAFARAPDGTFLFGGRGGLNAFHPERMVRNPVSPHTVVTRIEVTGGGKRRVPSAFPPQVVEMVPPERSLAVEVTSLDFTNPDRDLYRFLLDGYDEGWSEPSRDRTATFHNLPPGRYVLRALGTNADGIWDRTGTALPVVVRPTLWETAWFRGLLLLALAGVALGGHRLRLRSIRLRNERLERLVRKRTLQLEERRREAERHHRREELVNRIVHLIHEEVELEPLLRAILEGLSFAGSAERGLALVPREEGGHRVLASAGWLARSPEGAILPEGDLESYLGGGREAAPGIVVAEPGLSVLRELELEGEGPSRAVVALEIEAEATPLGTLLLQNTRSEDAFSSEEIETLRALRPHVTSAFLKGRILDELRWLNEQKNEFLGMAAHDLRSPLGGVISQIDLLHRFLDEERFDRELWDRFLSNVRRAAEGMLRLIEDLLDVAAIESGRVELEIQPFPLARLLGDRQRIHEIVAADKGIDLTVIAPPEGVAVEGDEPRVAEVLDNLLSNAIKFTAPGGSIEVGYEIAGSRIHLHVRDTGQGIPADELPDLFSGKKLTPRPTSGEPSTGLGLVIAKRLIELHGGHVWAASAPGEGSTFSFSLPRA